VTESFLLHLLFFFSRLQFQACTTIDRSKRTHSCSCFMCDDASLLYIPYNYNYKLAAVGSGWLSEDGMNLHSLASLA
jgi:hypothetical protein